MGGVSSAGPRPELGFLELEVLSGNVTDAEWRFGDGVYQLFHTPQPYVRVSFDDCTLETEPVKLATSDRTIFSTRLDFPLYTRVSTRLDAGGPPPAVDVAVYDRRMITGARDHPIVGNTTLVLEKSALEGRVRADLELKRRGAAHGSLLVQYRVVELDAMAGILHGDGSQNLRVVLDALSVILKASDGVKILLDCRPPQLTCEGKAEASMKKRLQKLLLSFQSSMSSCCDEDTDDAVVERLKQPARAILTITAEQLQDSTEDTAAVCGLWFGNIFAKCTRGMLGPPVLNTHRLVQSLKVAAFTVEGLVPIDKDGQVVPTDSYWRPVDGGPLASILGRGSFGCVWRAQDPMSRALYAVKVVEMRSSMCKAVAKREGEVASRLCLLRHPCVVRLIKVVQHPSRGMFSIVMEFCPGGDLAEQIARSWQEGIYNVPLKALDWVAQIFLGLEHLHLAAGILVRDVKADNVVLTASGRAKLTDFGLSRLDTKSTGHMTFGIPPGTPAYVAPEILRSIGYDYRADLYSFGVLTWTILAGGVAEAQAWPPCAAMVSLGDINALLNNWLLIKAAVEEPEKNSVKPLSEDARDFVLRLTNREPDWIRMDHAAVRGCALLESACLPAQGDVEAAAVWCAGFSSSGKPMTF